MGCAIGTVKYLVIVFNFLIALCGLFLVLEGLISGAGQYGGIVVTEILIGAVMFLISFLGCCGAIRESRCMLITFAVILLALFLLAVIFGTIVVLLYSIESDDHTNCRNEIRQQFQNYASMSDRVGLDAKQLEMSCCGVDGQKDFAQLNVFPSSCCKFNRPGCSIGDEDVHEVNCIDKCDETFWLIEALGIFLIVVAFVELVGAILAICLASSIKG